MSVKLLLNNIARPEQPKPKMWIGYVPFDESGENGYNDIDSIYNFDESILNLCKKQGTVAEFEEEDFPSSIEIELFGEGEYFFALVPEGYDFLIDAGLGTIVHISETGEQVQIDAQPLSELIGGVQYYLYGFMQLISGKRTFYLYSIS